MGQVRVAIGPVDATIARTWLENSRRIVAAVRSAPPPSLDVAPPVLDLIDAYLGVWLDAASTSSAFTWTVDVDATDLAIVARHWQRIAALGDDELAALDCAWAPAWTAPMYDALVAALTDALAQDERTERVAGELRERPPGTP